MHCKFSRISAALNFNLSTDWQFLHKFMTKKCILLLKVDHPCINITLPNRYTIQYYNWKKMTHMQCVVYRFILKVNISKQHTKSMHFPNLSYVIGNVHKPAILIFTLLCTDRNKSKWLTSNGVMKENRF